MGKIDFDKNFVIAILAGGIGIMLYEIFQLWYKLAISNTLSFEDYNKEFYPKAFAGFLVLMFALGYALLTRRNKSSNKNS